MAPAGAGAATITPDVLTDEDTNNASCSLREAVTAANTDGDYNGCNPGGADDVADTTCCSRAPPISSAGPGERADDLTRRGPGRVDRAPDDPGHGTGMATIDANGWTGSSTSTLNPTSITLVHIENLA